MTSEQGNEESTVPVIPAPARNDSRSDSGRKAGIQNPPKELTEEESKKQFELLKEKMTRTS